MYKRQDAYKTSYDVTFLLERYGLNEDAMGIATGWGYADALSAAAFCSKRHMVIRLADDTYINQMRDKGHTDSFGRRTNYYIFGGTSVVSDNVENYIRNEIDRSNRVIIDDAQRKAQRQAQR